MLQPLASTLSGFLRSIRRPWPILDMTSQTIAMWRGCSGILPTLTDCSRKRIGEGSDSFWISFPTTLPSTILGLLKVEAHAPIRKQTGTSGVMPEWRILYLTIGSAVSAGLHGNGMEGRVNITTTLF